MTASAAQDLFVTVDGNAYGLHGSAGRDAMVMALGNFMEQWRQDGMPLWPSPVWAIGPRW